MIRYKEEMWFPNLGTGETYRFRFLGGLLLLAAAADIIRITKQPILMMVFGVFGFVLTANGAAREIKRRSRALTQAGDFKERAVKTTGRIVSYDGGVKRYSFSKFPDGPINSHGFPILGDHTCPCHIYSFHGGWNDKVWIPCYAAWVL